MRGSSSIVALIAIAALIAGCGSDASAKRDADPKPSDTTPAEDSGSSSKAKQRAESAKDAAEQARISMELCRSQSPDRTYTNPKKPCGPAFIRASDKELAKLIQADKLAVTDINPRSYVITATTSDGKSTFRVTNQRSVIVKTCRPATAAGCNGGRW